MRSSTSSKGAYRFTDCLGNEEIIGGSLYQAITQLETRLLTTPSTRLYYLALCGDKIEWVDVSTKDDQHYHTKHQDYLYHLLFITDSPTSNLGYTKLASIVDTRTERLRDALRAPSNKKHLPFSYQSLLYIHYRLQQSVYFSRFDPKYMF
jgi:hypothetical protein